MHVLDFAGDLFDEMEDQIGVLARRLRTEPVSGRVLAAARASSRLVTAAEASELVERATGTKVARKSVTNWANRGAWRRCMPVIGRGATAWARSST